MKNVSHILLLNIHSMANAGDAVLNEVAVQQLKAAFPTAKITLAMNDPASHQDETTEAVGSFMYWLKQFPGQKGLKGWFFVVLMFCHSCGAALGFRRDPHERSYRWLWSPLLRSYQKADFAVSCPGNFLYSSGRVGITFLVTIFTLSYGLWLGKPLYMMPQTIGPLERTWERVLTRWILRQMRRVVVRDAVSASLLEELGFTRGEYDIVPDVAFGFAAAEPAQGLALLQEYQVNLGLRPILGVTLIHWAAQNHRFTRQREYEESVAQAIAAFIQTTGGQVILFSQVHGPSPSDDDRTPAQRVFANLPQLHRQLIYIDRPVSSHQLKSAYGLTDLFLGSRLHSTIFALSEHVPVVAIQYQYKTRGVFQMLGLEKWVIAINEITPERLIMLIQQAWSERETIRQHLQAVVPPLIRQTDITTRLIAQEWVDDHA